MNNALTPNSSDRQLPNLQNPITAAGQAANVAAVAYLFEDYLLRRSGRTQRTHLAALLLWVEFLAAVGAAESMFAAATDWAGNYFDKKGLTALENYAQLQTVPLPHVYAAHYCQRVPAAWQGVTWGLLQAFVKWMLQQGYAIASVNNRLAAVRIYAQLAAKAGVIPPTDLALIQQVRGYGLTEGKRVDEVRPKTRVGYKKAAALVLSAVQALQLKRQHPPTPQGIRDRLMFCLFLDLGLRTSEVAALRVDNITGDYVNVYRQKTDTTDMMMLTADLAQALRDYAPYLRDTGLLLRGSRKNGKLTNKGMSKRALGQRVKLLGRDILGLWELSPHDLRHTWATHAAQGSDPFVLRDAGGWSNMQTPSQYVERAKVVNKGIKLDY